MSLFNIPGCLVDGLTLSANLPEFLQTVEVKAVSILTRLLRVSLDVVKTNICSFSYAASPFQILDFFVDFFNFRLEIGRLCNPPINLVIKLAPHLLDRL